MSFVLNLLRGDGGWLGDAHVDNCRLMLARLNAGEREEFLRMAQIGST